MFSNFLKVFIYVAIVILFAACSAKKEEIVKLVIPAPPNDPKIFFDVSYTGDISFVERNSLDSFIGEVVSVGKINLAKPYGVAANGNSVYVSDTAAGAVLDIDEKLRKVSLIGADSPGKLAVPVGIAIDSEDNIYVSDSKSARILVYNKQKALITAFGKEGEFFRPTGIAINKKEKIIYIVDTKDHNIKAYTLDGKKLFTFGKRGKGEGEFNFPTNVAVDKRNGNVVIVDTQNFRVQVFDKDGKFIRKFGKIGDRPGMFARPKGVGVDSDGNIYVADSAFNNVQVFNDAGELLVYFGSTGVNIGQFSLIAGVYIDDNDRIYIVDGFNARVQIYQYVSDKWKEKNPIKYEKLKEI